MCALAALVAGSGCAMFAGDGSPHSQRPSNKWRVDFDQTATSDGTIAFLVSPVGGNAVSVSVPIAIGQTAEEIAQAARAAFATTLGESYEINPPRSTDIHVKKANRKLPDFGLRLVRLSAQDVKVEIDRE